MQSLRWIAFVSVYVLPWTPNYDAAQSAKIMFLYDVLLSTGIYGADYHWYFCLCSCQTELLQVAITHN